MKRFELMTAEYATTEIARMARLLKVSTSGYYKHRTVDTTEQLTPHQRRREELEVKIMAIHKETHRTYGSPRMTAELRDLGDRVSENTVAKIMAELGIEGISPRTFKVRTTVVDTDSQFPDDLVDRLFNRGRIDAVWTSDITYLTCGEGLMYFCAIKDEHSKRILGWRVDDHMREDLVSDTLHEAVRTRGGDCAGVILHSDRGSQYTSNLMARLCRKLGILRSMGATGICWDNAGAESLWSTFKHEYYYRHTFATKTELIAAVDSWVQNYNGHRRHSAIGQVSPINYETSLAAIAIAA